MFSGRVLARSPRWISSTQGTTTHTPPAQIDGPRGRRVLASAETCAAAKLMLCDTPAMRLRLERRRRIDHPHRFEAYRPSHDSETGRHRRTRASTSSSLVVNDEVTVQANARVPMWFARNVRQVCDRLVSRSGRYRDTVRSETMIPSFSNSPWIRGAPQTVLGGHAPNELSKLQIDAWPSRPPLRATLQHPRNPARCQRATVAAWTS